MEATALQGLTKMLGPILGAVGAGGGLFESYKQNQYQDKLRSLAEDPKKFMAYAQGFQQPLQAGLLQGTENQAQAYAAERGLATSPQLQQSIVSQAIAPILQQQQNQALQAAWNSLNLGGGANPGDPVAGLTSSLAQLQKLFPGQPTTRPWSENPNATVGGVYQSPVSTDPSINPYIQPDTQMQTFNPTPTDTPFNVSNPMNTPGLFDMTSYGFGGS